MTELVTEDNFAKYPRLKNLLRVLTICKGFALYFVSCNTIFLRESLVNSLKKRLNRPVVDLLLDTRNKLSIVEQAENILVENDESAVLFIYGLEDLYYLNNNYLMSELQWHRERYGKLKCPIVFWMPDFLITKIFHEAPDFMDWRSGIYEFVLPQLEQIKLLESTWQSVGNNFVGQLTLEEKERWIVSINNLLYDLGESGNAKEKIGLINRLGLLYSSLGQLDKALPLYEKCLKLYQEIRDKQGEGATLNNISQIYDAQGDYATALRYLQDSLKIQQEIDDKKGEGATLKGATLNNISQIYRVQGDYATALRYLQDSLKITQEIGDRKGEGATLNNISQIYDAQGDYATALRYLQDSLKIRQEIGDRQGEGATLNNLATAALSQGDYATALRYLQDSLKIQQEIGDKKGEGATLNNLATAALSQGDYATALRYLQDSLKIRQEIGDMAGMCSTLFNMGHIHLQDEEIVEAFAKWAAAYQIAKKTGFAQALYALDKLAKQLGGDGLEFWERSSE